MQIMFVCTGNQCRSVMAEYYMRAALGARSITGFEVRSAGTLYYPTHPADPLAVDVLKKDGIDASAHASTPVTADMSRNADLILCFEQEQVADLLEQNPAAVRKTFLFDDFVNACQRLKAEGTIPGDSPEDRLREIMDMTAMLRPFLPHACETEDPHRKPLAVFERVYAEIKQGVSVILDTIA